LSAPPGVDRCSALLSYEDAGRELIARLKYRNARSTVRWFAVWMAALVDAADVDVVTWVPTTRDRRRARGFDQAELLARAVGGQIRRPCRSLLTRGNGPPQTGRTLVERTAGPALAARPQPRLIQRVLLVDDVITTGTTITVAARALRCRGVEYLAVVAAARTPLKRARPESETFD
jgi:predicted amidophosphoribosyltransferase